MTQEFDLAAAEQAAELLAKFNDVKYWRGQNAFVTSATIGGGAEVLRQACRHIRELSEEVRLLSAPIVEDLGGGYERCAHPGMKKIFEIARKYKVDHDKAEARIAKLRKALERIAPSNNVVARWAKRALEEDDKA